MDPLEDEIRRYVGDGYRMVARTETSAQLVRPKDFNLAAAFAWLLCFGVGVLVYLAYYLSKADESVYLSVAQDGAITSQGAGRGGRGLTCRACGYQNSESRSSCKHCRKPLVSLVA